MHVQIYNTIIVTYDDIEKVYTCTNIHYYYSNV